VVDTDAATFNLTLSARTPYFINAWVINDTGEGVSDNYNTIHMECLAIKKTI